MKQCGYPLIGICHKAVITAADLPANLTGLAVSDESVPSLNNLRYIVWAFPSVTGDHL